MTSETIQRYARVVLYYAFGALASAGVTIPDNTKTLVAGIIGFLVTFAWTVWGNKLSNLLAEIQAKSGVEAVSVKVDPEQIDPKALASATPAAVTVAPVK